MALTKTHRKNRKKPTGDSMTETKVKKLPWIKYADTHPSFSLTLYQIEELELTIDDIERFLSTVSSASTEEILLTAKEMIREHIASRQYHKGE